MYHNTYHVEDGVEDMHMGVLAVRSVWRQVGQRTHVGIYPGSVGKHVNARHVMADGRVQRDAQCGLPEDDHDQLVPNSQFCSSKPRTYNLKLKC